MFCAKLRVTSALLKEIKYMPLFNCNEYIKLI
jgi:hypothetical protein